LDKIEEVYNERNILSKINHPSIVKLHSSFTDRKNVYMVFDYAINGDFAAFLKLNSK
jgi:serine/threonine protein kinase